MYQSARKIHLLVGLILAAVILTEAVTGLILAEPWLVGQGQQQRSQLPYESEQSQTTGNKSLTPGKQRAATASKPAPSSAFGLAKGLHQGKIGDLNLKWIVSITAIGLVILTLTGIYIAIPMLKPRRNRRTAR